MQHTTIIIIMNSYNKKIIIITVDHTGYLDDLVQETIDRTEQGTTHPSLNVPEPLCSYA